MSYFSAVLLGTVLIFFLACSYFAFESYREKEKRAFRTGLAAAAIALFLALFLWIPLIKIITSGVFILLILFLLSLCIPAKPNTKALQGTKGHLVDEPKRFDERDTVFARYRSLLPGSRQYREYYQKHPRKEKPDAERREKGFIGTPGSIDNGYQPNVAMMQAAFSMPPFLGYYAINEPEREIAKAKLSPEKATDIVKNLALHFGADMVGICKVDPNWLYSHRGEIHYNPEDWGREIKNLPEYAVVFLTEMKIDLVSAAPHTPTVAESAHLYARGAYISTLLAKWFSYMGYRGIAENTRNYDMPLPPLAVDAGLGEVGRLGYLIAPKHGARVRIFATLTDMPLLTDKPISVGVDEFCRRCKKCAQTCPSKSIPWGGKTVHNGAEKWKLDEESCYNYWSKIGTDCSICMAVCPFSRPDTLLHQVVRWLVAHSLVARHLFPYIDNFLYGKKWRPKPVPSWLAYQQDKKQVGVFG